MAGRCRRGITDASRDAESLSEALDAVFSGRRSWDDALAAHQAARDELTMPMFELTCQLASFAPPSADEATLFAAVASDRQASEDFVSVLAGTMPVQEFLDPANVGRYVAA